MTASKTTRSRTEKTRHTGIYKEHKPTCAWRTGSKCKCAPLWLATAWSKRDKKLIRKFCSSEAEAKLWRADALGAVKRGTMRAPTRTTVGEALDAYVAGMQDGSIRNRSDRAYKPAAIRSYRRAAEKLKAEIGHLRLDALRRRDVLDLRDRLRASGISDSTLCNVLDPLRAVCRRALDREEITVNPCANLHLPTPRGRRKRTAAPAEAEALIEALPEAERALWAMAIYIGPRRGELQEMRWSDLDLKAGVGRIERAWDDEGRCVVNVKSDAGERWFPIIAPVRCRLEEHQRLTRRVGDALVFGETAERRFVPSTVRRRARKAWKAAGLEPITLHEGRHSAATAGSAAGLDDLSLAHVMGHSSVVITRDRYGHVRPDRIAEVGKQLDAYYEASAGSG